MVRTNDTLVVTAERGAGNMSAEERVADLMVSDHDGAFDQKESEATKARMQWQPTMSNYAEAMQHSVGMGHGPRLPPPPGGCGNVSVPDNSRVTHNGMGDEPAELSATQGAKLAGPASLTKDWRTEGSRIGRYWENPDFHLKKYGTWAFQAGGRVPDQGKQ